MTQLKQLLRRAGMSQTELAARSGVSREHINHLCTGRPRERRTGGNAPVAIALAWALDVSLSELSDYVESWPLGPRSTNQFGYTTRSDYERCGA